jgi:uncharacterized protein (DUF1778 family)
MPSAQTQGSSSRGETINLRVSRRQKTLIDQAAQALGRTRSDFMLDIACREAETVLLDRRLFLLSDEAFTMFVATLDKPPKNNLRLRHLLEKKTPWQK